MALKVHVTGVSGLIGDVVYAHLAAQPDRYTVTGSGRRYDPSARVARGRPLNTMKCLLQSMSHNLTRYMPQNISYCQ